jgi:hypothetical protein
VFPDGARNRGRGAAGLAAVCYALWRVASSGTLYPMGPSDGGIAPGGISLLYVRPLLPHAGADAYDRLR